MGYFDDILADTNDVFMDAFAERELVVYRPVRGLPRSIRAIVDREPPAPPIPGLTTGGQSAYVLMITVENDPVTGIAHSEFDTADRIDVSLVMGGPKVNRGFSAERAAVDAGMLTLKVV